VLSSVFIITGMPAHSAAMPVLFLLSGPKMFFAPQGRHVAWINVKFGTGVHSAVLNFTFIVAEICEYTPKTVKISNIGHKFYSQGRLICTILQHSQRLYAPIDSF